MVCPSIFLSKVHDPAVPDFVISFHQIQFSTVAISIVIVILEVLVSRRSVIEDSGLNGCDAASLSKWFSTFRRNVSPSSSIHDPRFRFPS